ncbi:MAG: hypothetical protein WCQ77_13640 [Planctomycetota bacterium]
MNTKVLTIAILIASFLSFLLSVYLWFSGAENAKEAGMFVGLWVPSILSFGNLMNGSVFAQGRK